MKPRLRKRLVLAMATALASFLALNAIAFAHARAMTHFVREDVRLRTGAVETLDTLARLKVLFLGVDLPRPVSTVPSGRLGAATQSVVIPVAGGVRLGAWYHSGASGRPLAILFHGYGGEKTGCLPEAELLQRMGLGVLLVDFRGAGESSECYTTIGYLEAEDVEAAVAYARERLGAGRIVLYGHSMGGAAILRAVGARGVQVDGLIVESVFDTLQHAVERRFEMLGVPSFPCAYLLSFWGGAQFGFNAFAHSPLRYAAGVSCPVVFFHGSEDTRAPLEQARLVFENVRGGKEFVTFAGLGHAQGVLRYPEAWRAAVERLLEKAQSKSEQR